jgi:hypothetical protein
MSTITKEEYQKIKTDLASNATESHFKSKEVVGFERLITTLCDENMRLVASKLVTKSGIIYKKGE